MLSLDTTFVKLCTLLVIYCLSMYIFFNALNNNLIAFKRTKY